MIVCNHCLTENQEGAVYCSGCGAKLEDQVNESVDTFVVNPHSTPDLDALKPKKSKKGLFIVLLLVVIALASILGVQAFTRLNPVARLTYGLAQLNRQNEVSTRITFTTKIEPTIDKFFETITFNSDVYTNRKTNYSHIAYNLSHEGDALVSLVMAAEVDGLFIDLPEIFKENDYLYYPISDQSESVKPEDYEKYMKMVDWKSMPIKAYAELLDEMLKDSADNRFSSTTFTLTGEDFINLFENYLDLLDDDDALILWTQENMVKVLEAMIADDFIISGVSKDDLEMFLDAVDSRSFIKEYRDVLEEIISEYDLVKRTLKTQARSLKFELLVEYSLFNKITKMVITPSFDKMNMTIVMDYTSDFKPQKTYDPKKGRAIEDLDSEAFAQMGKDVIVHLKSKIEKNKSLETYLNDLVKPLFIESIYTLFDEFSYMLEYQFDNPYDDVWSDSYEDYNSEDALKVGLLTTVIGFSEGTFAAETFEGLVDYEANWGYINSIYFTPDSDSTDAYLEGIYHLVQEDVNVIILPGFYFEEAAYIAQDLYPQIKFILLDGQPHSSDYSAYYTAPNVAAAVFNENEAGFLAGIAAALESNTGKIAFLGGMKIPSVDRYGYGFWAGMHYANVYFGTNVEMAAYEYINDFNNPSLAQQRAAALYNQGVDIIMHAVGNSASGLYDEAIRRAQLGESVYVIGSEKDEYVKGFITEGSVDYSVTLTSAIKRFDMAAQNLIDDIYYGVFPGGDTSYQSLDNGAVGLPYYNPNLSYETTDWVYEAELAVYYGEVTVPDTYEALQSFLLNE